VLAGLRQMLELCMYEPGCGFIEAQSRENDADTVAHLPTRCPIGESLLRVIRSTRNLPHSVDQVATSHQIWSAASGKVSIWVADAPAS
jgi:hypothetical protein